MLAAPTQEGLQYHHQDYPSLVARPFPAIARRPRATADLAHVRLPMPARCKCSRMQMHLDLHRVVSCTHRGAAC